MPWVKVSLGRPETRSDEPSSSRRQVCTVQVLEMRFPYLLELSLARLVGLTVATQSPYIVPLTLARFCKLIQAKLFSIRAPASLLTRTIVCK